MNKAKLSAGSTSIEFDKSYGSGYCIPLWLRDIQVKSSISKVKARVPHSAVKNKVPVAIVGYGPSLKNTWEQLKEFKVIFTTSGAHKFLIDRGIIPTYHVDVDPRAHKIDLLGEIHKEVTYFPCSTVHPNYIDRLLKEKADVRLWHCFSVEQEALRILPPGDFALTGGCDAGMRAMSVARYMGYVNHHVFGMDGCSFDESGHADKHTNPMKKFFDLTYNGKTYRTSPHLMEVAKTVPHEVSMLKLDSVKFYGDGLVGAIYENTTKANVKESNIAFCKPELISKSYKKTLVKRHAESSVYGSDGFRYQEIVKKLVNSTKAQSVLDYGCGKGVLANKLDFPIWEYDPAIKGKESTPRPADLVICTNVLECVEDKYLADVLGDLSRCVKKVGYFVIGDNRLSFWNDVLSKYFYIGKVSLENGEIVAVVGPKVSSIKKQTPKNADKKEALMVDEVVNIKIPNKTGLMTDFIHKPVIDWTYSPKAMNGI